MTDPKPQPPEERIYACGDCGAMRCKSDGKIVSTLCADCWDKHYPISAGEPVPAHEPMLIEDHPFAPMRCNHPVGVGACIEAEDHSGPHIADDVYKLFAKNAAEAFAAGQKAEREAVVKYLRDGQVWWLSAADHVERGEHVRKEGE